VATRDCWRGKGEGRSIDLGGTLRDWDDECRNESEGIAK